MILVDTSVWAAHWRKSIAPLNMALAVNEVCMHPFVLAELALGHLHPRHRILTDLASLTSVSVATHAEVMALIERSLAGTGVGYVDAHLLAAAQIADDVWVWTRDKTLAAVAKRLGIGIEP